MPLKLYYHPLSSFCHKALIALYEKETAFEPVFIDLGNEDSRAELRTQWPLIKFPVLRDEERGFTVAESSAVIEYLDLHYPGALRLIPRDPDQQWQSRMWDRVFDHSIHHPMQKIVADSFRPDGHKDGHGVEQAQAQIAQAYDLVESRIGANRWMLGDDFTIADCAAAPALFYANTLSPFGPEHPRLAGYLNRLMERPSYARALREAEPYFNLFPLEPKPRREPVKTLSPA